MNEFWIDPFNSPMLLTYFTLALVAITIVLTFMVMISVIKVLNALRPPEQRKASWWEKFIDNLNASVPVAEEQAIDTGHAYDGIRELDNHLPPWWKGLFYATIVWAAGYIVVYHFTRSLPLQEGEYTAELIEAEANAKVLLASRPAVSIDESTLEYAADAELIGKGKLVFGSNNCGSCHRNDGGGNSIGPNLTDEYWLHGGHVRNVFNTINKGVVEKGMPAWGKVMSQEDVRNVSFYVMSLKGSNPPDSKAPQGELYAQESEPAPATNNEQQTTNNE